MEGIHEFIVQIEKPLKDTIKAGEVELFIDPKYNQTQHSNRLGTVISVPPGLHTEIKPGYQVMIIPTILLKQTYRGVMKEPSHLINKDQRYYRVANDLIVLYRANENEQWVCNHIFLLVKPIKVKKEEKVVGSIIIPDTHYVSDVAGYQTGNVKQWGIVKYINQEAIDEGLNAGDKVYFKDHGEYEYEVDGEILYCMDNLDVLAKESA